MTQAQATLMTRQLVEEGQPLVIALAASMAAYKVNQLQDQGYTCTQRDMAEIAHNARVLAEETLAKRAA